MWLVRVLVVLLLAVAAAYAGMTGAGPSDPQQAFQLMLPESSQRWVSTVSTRAPTRQENAEPDVEQRDRPIRVDDIIRALDRMHN
jgi:hypothetical protein